MRNLYYSIFFLLFLSSVSSCIVAYGLAMRDKVFYKKEWKQEDFKVKIIGKKGGFGPPFYVCEIFKKEKFFYIKVSEKYFSKSKMNSCILICSYNQYQSIEVDVCQFKIQIKTQ